VARGLYSDFLQTCWFQLYDLPEPDILLPSFLPYHLANQPVAGFNGVTFPGLTGNTDEVKEAIWPWPHKFVSSATFDQLVLRKGMSSENLDFITWALTAIAGLTAPRRSLILYSLDKARYARRGWLLYNAIPQSYRAPDFDASSTDIAVEELTLEVHTIMPVPLGSGFSLGGTDVGGPTQKV
jgi:phage tail-like protein